MIKSHAHELSVTEEVHEIKCESILGKVLKNSFYKGGIPGSCQLVKKLLPGT